MTTDGAHHHQSRRRRSIEPDDTGRQIRVFTHFLHLSPLSMGALLDRNTKRRHRQYAPFINPAPMRADGAPAPPLDTWWEGFGDRELTRIVQRALDQNLDLAASVTRVEQARAAAKEAGARLKPSGALNAQSTSFRQSLESPTGRVAGTLPGFDRNQSYLDLGVAASWEIDLFGGLRHGAQAASAEVQAAEAEHLGTRVSIVAEAADAYMQIRGAQARLTFAREQIATDEHLLQLVSQRTAAGVASDREQAQAEAVLAQAKATVPQLAIILEAQLNRLDVLMGVQPGAYASELRTPANIPIIPSITSLADPSELLRRRPDIIAAERRIAASNARIGQALAEYYPRLSLSGFLGNEAISPGKSISRERISAQRCRRVAVEALRLRKSRCRSEVRDGRQCRGDPAIPELCLAAAEDVEDSFSQLAQSELRGDEILVEIAALQRVRDRSQEAYEAGAIALTDVLDADRQTACGKRRSRIDERNCGPSSGRLLQGPWRWLGHHDDGRQI